MKWAGSIYMYDVRLTRSVDFDLGRITAWNDAGRERTLGHSKSFIGHVDLVRSYTTNVRHTRIIIIIIIISSSSSSSISVL